MKKLANTNPFILLLAPLFVMMVLAFAYNKLNHFSGVSLVMKTTTSTSQNLIQILPAIIK